MTKVVIDLETTGTKEYGRMCNPLNPNHEVNVYAEYRGPNTEPLIITDFEGDLRPYLDLKLDGVTHIIGHNIKFDLLFLWDMPQIQEFFARGGKIWDTMLAEYFIRGHRPGELDLNSVAIKYGGHGKEDGIKELWKQGLTTKEIGQLYPEKFLQYAKYDVIDPWIITGKQIEKLKKTERLKAAEIYMEHWLATIEMEYNGISIDTELGLARGAVVKEELKELLIKLSSLVRPVFTDKLIFSPTDRIISAVLFGGELPYTTQIPNPTKLGETHYKTGAKVGQLRTKKATVIEKIPGYKLTTNHSQKMKTGAYQVDNKSLSTLKKVAEGDSLLFIETLLQYRKKEKILTTYYQTDPDNPDLTKQKGLLTLVHPDGYLHPELKATNTVTGRLASSNPNGQNLNKPVQELVKSRWGDEGRIIELDYSNLEVITKGGQSGCKQLIEDYVNGLDTHCLNTALALGMEYDEVYRLYKEGDIDITEKRRTIGKPITFEGEYGKRPEDTARDNGIEEALVVAAAEAKRARYPEVFALEEQIEEDIKMSRRPDIGLLKIKKSSKNFDNELPVGYYNITSADAFNIRHNDERAAVGFYRNPWGQVWRYPEIGVLTQRGQVFRYFNGPIMKNYYNQGFAAFVMKTATGRVFREYAIKNRDTMRLILEVHDSLIIDCKGGSEEIHIPAIKKIMESVAEYINGVYTTNMHMPLRVDYGVGRTWLEAKEGG